MNIFKEFVKDNELYVDATNWEVLKANYTQEHIIQQISDAIIDFEIKLPYREITLDDVENEYSALLNKNDLIQEGKWVNKFEYKYPFIDKYIGISNIGNKASDYFHQIERWKCDATGYPSPQKTWEIERFRLTLFKALFSLKVTEINPQVLRNIISLRKYIASQFRPSAAKAIYDYFKAETVLDFSMGWGDRILGAHASEYVKKYVGFDSWMENFLFKSIELRTENLKSGGHLAINISDIYTRKKLYKICDKMNDYIASTNKFDYIGAMGFRMPKRPMSKSSNTIGVYGEPIWIWKKK